MLTEPIFLFVVVLVAIAVLMYLFSSGQKKELREIDNKLEQASRTILGKVEHAFAAENRKLAEQAESKLDATADRMNQSLEVLRSAIEHQTQQQERIVRRLEALETIVSGASSEGASVSQRVSPHVEHAGS